VGEQEGKGSVRHKLFQTTPGGGDPDTQQPKKGEKKKKQRAYSPASPHNSRQKATREKEKLDLTGQRVDR